MVLDRKKVPYPSSNSRREEVVKYFLSCFQALSLIFCWGIYIPEGNRKETDRSHRPEAITSHFLVEKFWNPWTSSSSSSLWFKLPSLWCCLTHLCLQLRSIWILSRWKEKHRACVKFSCSRYSSSFSLQPSWEKNTHTHILHCSPSCIGVPLYSDTSSPWAPQHVTFSRRPFSLPS